MRPGLSLGLFAGFIFTSVVVMAQVIPELYGKGGMLKVGLAPTSTLYFTEKNLLIIDYQHQLTVTTDDQGHCQSAPFAATRLGSKGQLELAWQKTAEEIFAEAAVLAGPAAIPGNGAVQELQLQLAPRAMLSRRVIEPQLQWGGMVFTPGFLSLRLSGESGGRTKAYSRLRHEVFNQFPLLRLLDPVGLEGLAGGRVVAVSWQSGPWTELAEGVLTEQEAEDARARFCGPSSANGMNDKEARP